MVDKQYLIDLNEKILKTFAQHFPGTDVPLILRPEIDDVLPYVESIQKTGDELSHLTEKAAHLMSYLSWAQPFGDGNKRTGLIAAAKFLRDNDYELNLNSIEEQREIRRLLYSIQDERTNLDLDVVKQIIFYISKRITKHEPIR